MAIHTSHEVMIGGCSLQCKEFIQHFNVNVVSIPYKAALHTPPAKREFSKFKEIFSLPTQKQPIQLYFNSVKEPIEQGLEKIAQALASTCCNTVNFPAIVQQAYAAGARVFIEAGARDNCSYWISKTLADKPHVAVPLNIKGLDEWLCLLKALASLIANGIKLDLTPIVKLFTHKTTSSSY